MKRRKEEKKERKRWAETRRTAQSAEPFDPSQAGLRADLPSRPSSHAPKLTCQLKPSQTGPF